MEERDHGRTVRRQDRRWSSPLPGAFTPTRSSTHLPRYNELASVFAKHGVDDILCVSVNDTFVMNEWSGDQESAEHHR